MASVVTGRKWSIQQALQNSDGKQAAKSQQGAGPDKATNDGSGSGAEARSNREGGATTQDHGGGSRMPAHGRTGTSGAATNGGGVGGSHKMRAVDRRGHGPAQDAGHATAKYHEEASGDTAEAARCGMPKSDA